MAGAEHVCVIQTWSTCEAMAGCACVCSPAPSQWSPACSSSLILLKKTVLAEWQPLSCSLHRDASETSSEPPLNKHPLRFYTRSFNPTPQPSRLQFFPPGLASLFFLEPESFSVKQPCCTSLQIKFTLGSPPSKNPKGRKGGNEMAGLTSLPGSRAHDRHLLNPFIHMSQDFTKVHAYLSASLC